MREFTGSEFEDEVRRICRSLFSNSIGQGAEKHDGRERDGVFWNGNFFTIVEATTDKKKAKAELDGKKTHDLVAKRRSEGNMAQGYLVTLHDPTADQRAAVKRYERTTKIVSFDELRSLLFDSMEYIRTRSGRPFGSVYDHVSHSFDVPRSDFVQPTITVAGGAEVVPFDGLIQGVMSGERLVITAEYGIGKSMLLREIFFSLARNFSLNLTFRCPIVINLRDHIGQDDPVELLERHARNNAVDPRKLVAAWSAGYTDLIIDGFDELSTRGWTGDHRRLREFRRSSHSVVKKLIQQTPRSSAVVISGRAAYFDSEGEMREALGAPEGVFQHLNVQPFDSQQATDFLRRKGHSEPLPQWIPTRPLFLSYLINKGLIQEAVQVGGSGAFPEGAAWYSLLTMIAGRESNQSEGVDQDTIMKFWGLLATRARQGGDSQKSFSPSEIDEIFFLATGNTVTEDERGLLLRLPGLGVSPDNPASRTFIDVDFLNASSACLLVAHIQFPFGEEPYRKELRSISVQLNSIGVQVVCAGIERGSVPQGTTEACLTRELEQKCDALAFDVFRALVYLGSPKGYFTFQGIESEEIDLCQEIWDNVKVDFSNCLVSNLIVPSDAALPAGVSFTECMIGNVEGRASAQDLPCDKFIDCDIDKFSESYSVNDEVLSSNLPLGVRVLVVTLRKIYAQAGSSRLESALLRGLDHRARMIAPEVIDCLVRQRFLMMSGRQGRTIYVGTRAKRKEALGIIQSPASSAAPVVEECRQLS